MNFWGLWNSYMPWGLLGLPAGHENPSHERDLQVVRPLPLRSVKFDVRESRTQNSQKRVKIKDMVKGGIFWKTVL